MIAHVVLGLTFGVALAALIGVIMILDRLDDLRHDMWRAFYELSLMDDDGPDDDGGEPNVVDLKRAA